MQKISTKGVQKKTWQFARHVHWQLCNKGGFERANKWYEQHRETVLENENFRPLRDFTIQYYHRVIEPRRPGIVLVAKRSKEVKIADITVPGDSRVKDKQFVKFQNE